MFAIKVSGKVSRRLMGNKGKRTVPESPCWKLNVNYCKMCEDVPGQPHQNTSFLLHTAMR